MRDFLLKLTGKVVVIIGEVNPDHKKNVIKKWKSGTICECVKSYILMHIVRFGIVQTRSKTLKRNILILNCMVDVCSYDDQWKLMHGILVC